MEKQSKVIYKNNLFNILAPASSERFDIPHELYSESDTQDYFDHIQRFINICY